MTSRRIGTLAAVVALTVLAPLSAVGQTSAAASACQPIGYLEPPIGTARIVIDQVEGHTALAPIGSRHERSGPDGICVLLFREGNETPVAVGTTNERGRFALPRPAPGSYILVAASLDTIDDLAVSVRLTDTPADPERGLLLHVRAEEDDRGGFASAIPHLALRRELLEMARVDQAVRNEWMREGPGTPSPELLSRMVAIDAANTARLQDIVEEHGWPGSDLVGLDGARSAFLIVQHATHDVQKTLFPLVEAGYREGVVSGPSYALLLDRILVRDGRPQLYGSQAGFFDGELVLEPIEDEANVDVRRAEVGLPPLVEYVEQLKSLVSSPR